MKKMIIQEVTKTDGDLLLLIKKLFIEYAHSLHFDLDFQNFDKELEQLPGDYSLPHGTLFIAIDRGEAIGCVALKRINDTTCEVKIHLRSPFFERRWFPYVNEKIVCYTGIQG
jgi:hypothetical protein